MRISFARASESKRVALLRLVSGLDAPDLIIRPIQIPTNRPYCCRSDRKVDELRDSVRFRTDASGVKVGHGNRGVNEQTDF